MFKLDYQNKMLEIKSTDDLQSSPLHQGFSPDWNGGGAVAERSGAIEAKAGTVESGFKKSTVFYDRKWVWTKKMRSKK